MRRMYSEAQVKKMIIETLSEFGIEINNSGELELNVPVRFDEALYVKEDTDEQVLVPKPTNADLGKFCKVGTTGVGWFNN